MGLLQAPGPPLRPRLARLHVSRGWPIRRRAPLQDRIARIAPARDRVCRGAANPHRHESPVANVLPSCGEALTATTAGRQLTAITLSLAPKRRQLADREIPLLIDQPPLVEVRQHDARRLLGKIGGAR